ncbi:MAG: family 43 glycosylhydrolase, partial [Micromonosporaceae bacterium]
MRASTKPAIGAILSLLLISPWWGEASAPAADLREASSSTALSNAGTGGAAETYSNPVANDAAADFPDPSIIRGRDGYWYAYSTRTRLNPGGTPRNLPMMKSRDLVSWEYIGDVFDDSNRPSWFDAGSTTWGPSIEYIDGRYVMYFVGVDIPGHAKPNKSLGVATAPTPAGPWTDSGAPLIEPQFYQRPPQNELRHRSLIAPDGVQGADGRRYLYYGGFNGGIFGVPLNDNGTVVDGDAVQLVDDAHFEGPYVVRRKDWYYMFVSSNHCCTGGPVAGYTGWAVRSRNPLGPFKDHQGLPAKGTYPGGAPVSFANGNRFVSPGVNTLTTDLSGQDWMVYHAVDREHPYLEGPFQGGLQRGLYIDRLDWIDGWPTVREGQGP